MNRKIIYQGLLLLSMATSCAELDLTEYSPPDERLFQTGQLSTKGEDLYYYYFEERIALNECRDLLLICFEDAQARQNFIQNLGCVSSLKIWNPARSVDWAEDNSYNILVLQGVTGDIPVDQTRELESMESVRYVSYLYGERERDLASVSDEFAVKLSSRYGYSGLENLAKTFECEVVRRKEFGDDVWFVRRPKDSENGTVRLSSIFFETGLFEFTAPRFFWLGSSASADTYYSAQWGLKNTGQNGVGTSGFDINVESAWNITEGSSDIVIAVIDDGVELSHPDLYSNLVSGYDAIYHSSSLGGAPLQFGQTHGTAVAGIAGAVKDNGIGISGVAPACKIMPIRAGEYIAQLNESSFDADDAITAFDWARLHGVDVINCSWGGGLEDALLTAAINNAAINGRNGKGCVIVFSSGNTKYGDNVNVSYPGYLSNVIAVGAISYNGKRKNLSTPDNEPWSSNYGSSLDISAPGVLISTTTTGGGYINNFNGTSSAAPHVSGIAALLLSEYPDLTQSEVRYLIESGATYLPGHSYYSDGGYPARAKSNEVGYGLANAAGAFQQAALLQQKKILDATPGVDFTITNNSSYTVDDIYLEVTADVGGISTTLISVDPGGLESGEFLGYPVYRGESFSASPGTAVTNISVSFYARTLDCSGDLQIGIEFDNHIPTFYSSFAFGWGDTYQTALPNTTVPTASRRRLYINILDI